MSDRITTNNGWFEDGDDSNPYPASVRAEVTDPNEVLIQIQRDGAWDKVHTAGAYLTPVEAARLGERLIAAANEALVDG